MTDNQVFRLAGWCALAAIVLVLIELPLWIFPGNPPPISDADGLAKYLSDIRVAALSRVLLDMGIYICLMVFFAGFRHRIIVSNSRCEWLATLVFGAGAVWWSVLLVANSLQGGAVLHTVGGSVEPTAVRALVEGTLLIFNGSVAFAAAGLFFATAGYAIHLSKALPRITVYLAWAGAALCLAAMPAVFVDAVDTNHFYNAAGWGPGAAAFLTPVVWFSVAGVAMIKTESAQLASDDTQPA